MCGSAEPHPAFPGRLRAVLLALALAFAAAWPAGAQTEEQQRQVAVWDIIAGEAEQKIADQTTSTVELERLRERLVRMRAEAAEAERASAPLIEEMNSRLEALGPAPAEGAEEAPEIADRRKALGEQVAAVQVPTLEAKDAYQQANQLIDSIDGVIRARFTAELRNQGPSPLRPRNWAVALDELVGIVTDAREAARAALSEPWQRAILLKRLPINILLVAAGVVLGLASRRWLVDWAEAQLATASGTRAIAALVALRNLARLIVPAIAAGLLFAALNPDALLGRTANQPLFWLPTFILVLIWAGWLGHSVFSPSLPAFRLVPVEDRDAAHGARLTMFLGGVLAFEVLMTRLGGEFELRPATLTTLYFPLILLGALGLWRTGRLIARVESRFAPSVGKLSDQASGVVGLRFLRTIAAVLRGIAVLAPLLAAAGYFAAARFLVFPTVLTLGLIGSALVVFALLSALGAPLMERPGDRPRPVQGGLVPVVIAALIFLACLPLLALIWGARASELGDLWTLLRDGVTFGGIRVSASGIVKFAAVLAIGILATRLIQSLLRGSVLPRTRLDAGGRNAVLAGVGYVGYSLAALAAVSAAGLDLSNIAIVAGALSVGIGFGLQNVVSNFVSGIILLVERPIKEGDWIEVGAFSGYVRGISVRSTEIETFDRASVILPNSDLVSGTVLNRTHKGMSGRLQVLVNVAYDADPRRVEEVLLGIAEAHPLVLQDPPPVVLFTELGADSMNFEIRCWLRDVNYTLSVRSDMNFEIFAKLTKAGIHLQPFLRDARPPHEEPPEIVAVPETRPAKSKAAS